ncbi:MAG: hypothetical protein O7D91_07300 [Planctomycetota bacterium]|nr:hypothetical protein [Planctomycetota bacterium]
MSQQKMLLITGVGVVLGALLTFPLAMTFAQESQPKHSAASIDARMASAWLRLVEAKLEMTRNQGRAPYLTVVYERAREGYSKMVEEVKKGATPSSFDVLLFDADNFAAIAKKRLEYAESVRAKSEGIVSDADFEKLKARQDILSLAAEQGHNLRTSTPEQKLDWQLKQMRRITLLMAEKLFDEGL